MADIIRASIELSPALALAPFGFVPVVYFAAALLLARSILRS
jgi:hypothetical protein